MRLIFLGAPGAGKGTQAEILSRRLNIPTISTGVMLRREIIDDTPVGREAKEYIGGGRLAPDEMVIQMLRERISMSDCENGYILDGVPRTIPQAEAIEKIGLDINTVLYLEVSDEEIVERMAGRRACSKCGAPYHIVNNPPTQEGICDYCAGTLLSRKDDLPETVRERLRIYRERTEPLVEFYEERGILRRVRNQPGIEVMTKEILSALGIS